MGSEMCIRDRLYGPVRGRTRSIAQLLQCVRVRCAPNPRTRRTPILGVKPAPLHCDLPCHPASGLRKAGRDHPPSADPSRRRPTKRGGRRVCRRIGHASVVLGTVGHIPQAIRGNCGRKPARVGSRRPSKNLGRHALQGRDPLFPDQGRREANRPSPVAQATALFAPCGPGFAAPWYRHRL